MGFLRKVEREVKSAGRKIDDQILQPVKNTVEAIVEDPRKLAGVALAVAFPGAGAALGAQLGLTGAAAQVVGQAIINTAVNGGDVKAAVISAAVPVVGQQASQVIGNTLTQSGITGTVNTVITDAATRGLTAAALGKDPLAAMVLSGTTSAVNLITAEIPGFDGLHPSAQSAIKNAVATKLNDGNVGQSLVDSAVKFASDEFTAYQKRESALKDLSAAGLDFGLDYSKLTPEQRDAVDAIAKAPEAKTATELFFDKFFGRPSTPTGTTRPELIEKYKDTLYTDESEASEMARSILGREPTKFEIMEFIGLSESNAKSMLENLKWDESTFDSNELAEAYKAVYGKEPTAEWLASDEAMDMLGRSDAQGKNLLQNFYTQDKNTTNKTEAEAFWKAMGNTGPIPEETLFQMLAMPETGAKALSETYKITRDDINATTFDGTKFKDQKEAQAAAIKDGYNTYNWSDNTYYLMSQDQATQLQKDIADGKTAGARPDAFFTLGPGATLAEQLAAAGNPEEYAYKQGDTITVVGKRMAVPEYEDLEAWKEFKDEKQAAGGDNFQSFLTEQFSILQQALKGAPEDSIGKVMADAAMFGYGKMAQLVSSMAGAGEARGIPQAERAKNIAKQVESWSNKLVSQGIQNAESAVLANVAVVTKESIAAQRGVKPSDISTAELYAQKTAALFKQIPNNPLGVSLFLAGEGIQEIPLLAASGGVGNVLKLVATKGIQMAGATGTNVFLNGTESFGGNYNEVKDYLRKQGIPESQIEALAIKSGFEAMAVGMMTAYVGDRALIKSFMGDLATDSFGKVVATNSAKEWFLGNFEGSLQNMSAQIGKYGSIKSEDEWLNAGIMEGFAQKGIAAGVLTAASLDKAVAKDYDGKPVTYREVIEGTKTFDPKTLDKSFSFGDGVNLGDAIGYHSTFITNPDITPDEYFYTAKAFRDNGLDDFTPQEIASIVGSPGEMALEEIQRLSEPYAETKIAESKTANVTPAQVEKIVNDAIKANPSLTPADVQKIVSDAVATVPNLTAEQVQQIVGTEVAKIPAGVTSTEVKKAIDDAVANIKIPAGLTKTDVSNAISEYMKVNPNITAEDVAGAISEYMTANPGLTKTDLDNAVTAATKDFATTQDIEAAIAGIQFPAGLSKDDVATAISDYMKANPGLSLTDVASKITDATKGLATSEGVKADIAAAVKGFATNKDIETAIANIKFPAGITKEDVAAEIKTYMEANPGLSLADVATKITDATKGLATTEGTKTAISDALKGYATKKDIETAIAGIKFPEGISKADVTDSISEYMKANPGLSISDVATKIADATKDLATTEGTKTAISDALKGYATSKDIETAIAGIKFPAGITSEDVAAEIKKAMDANPGLTAEDVTGAITAYMTANPGLTAADLDTAISTATKDLATTEQVGAVQTDVDALEKLIGSPSGQDTEATGIIGQLEAMGLTDSQILEVIGTPATETEPATGLYKAADDAAVRGENAAGAVQTELSKIIGAPSVADDPATLDIDESLAATGLYRQIEASQSETAGAIDTLSADVQAKYEALTTAQKATADALVAQGTTLADAIEAAKTETASKIETLSADVQAKYDALTTEQKALAEAMNQQGLDLTAAIDLAAQQTQQQITGLGEQVDLRINELMQQGKNYQEATQQAIGELNTQNQQMRDLIGTQGRTATQADIDVLNQMLGGQRSMDLAYDVTGDKQITQADIDFLTQIVAGTKTDWRAPAGSVFAPTGLYGQLAANEAQRQADVQAQLAREQAAAAQAAEAQRQANIQNMRTQGQQGVRSVMQQLQDVQKAGMAPQPVQVVEAGPGFDISDALNTGFFSGFQAKKAQQNQPQTTKIAAGGYIDDLLAGDMTADDLLNLLR